MNDMTNAPATTKATMNFLVPRTMEEAMAFSTTLSKSELVPKDFQSKPANILVAIQWGMELGLQPMQAMQSIAVINGRPSLWGDAVIGLVRASGLCEYIYEDVATDGTSATCRTKRSGEEEVKRTFTMADAEKAGLKGKQGPWTQYPKRMLQMRARSWCLRDVYPDVLRGVHVAEEAQDIPEKDVTPASAAAEVEQPQSRSKPAPVEAEVVHADALDRKVDGEREEALAIRREEKQPEAPAADAPKPAAASTAGKPMLEGQVRILKAKLAHAALTEKDLIAKFGAVEDLKFEQFEDVQHWINERAAKIAG